VAEVRLTLKVQFEVNGKLEDSYFLAGRYRFVFDGNGKLSVQDTGGQVYYRYGVRAVETVEVQWQ